MNKWTHVQNCLLERKLYLDIRRLQAFHLFPIPTFSIIPSCPNSSSCVWGGFCLPRWLCSIPFEDIKLNRKPERNPDNLFSKEDRVPQLPLQKGFGKTISLNRSGQPKWEKEPISASLKHDLFPVFFNFPSLVPYYSISDLLLIYFIFWNYSYFCEWSLIIPGIRHRINK